MNKAECDRMRQFKTAEREDLRLHAAALIYEASSGDDDLPPEVKQYLKRRIRPAMMSMIRENRTDLLRKADSDEWFTGILLDECIEYAVDIKQTECVVLLLKIKAERFGYHDRDLGL